MGYHLCMESFLKNDTNELITKQTHKNLELTYGYQGRSLGETEG